MIQILMYLPAAWLCADFMGGLIHWWEDRVLGRASRFRFIQGIIDGNEVHHAKPTELLRYSLWQNMNTTAAVAWPIAFVAVAFGFHFIGLVAFFGAFGNVVHRWAHTPRSKCPRIVQALQRVGLFSSQIHHAGHHFERGVGMVSRTNASIRYCPMSDWLNPVLDRIGFFALLTKIFVR